MKQRLSLLVLFLVAMGPIPAHAATVVTNCVEYTGPGGLADALFVGGDIVFACDGVIIVQPAGLISRDTSLDAAGHDVTLSGADRESVLSVQGASLTLIGMKIQDARRSAVTAVDARLAVVGSQFSGNHANWRPYPPPPLPPLQPLPTSTPFGGAINAIESAVTVSASDFVANSVEDLHPRPVGGGGAIYIGGGSLAVTNSTFMYNRTSQGSAQAGTGKGGAILFSGQSLTIRESSFQYNDADSGGGAVAALSGIVEITDSVLEGNSAGGLLRVQAEDLGTGGALLAAGTSLAVADSQFLRNNALGGGGAIDSRTGPVTIAGSTFAGNQAGLSLFPGIALVPGTSGGAIRGGSEALSISGSSFSNNLATFSGGAVSAAGTVGIATSTFDSNAVTPLLPGSEPGGGAVHGDGIVTIQDSTLTRNEVRLLADLTPLLSRPGGGAVDGDTVTVIRSTLSANAAAGDGGAIRSTRLEATTTTFNHNTAGGDGGAIASGETSIARSTLAFNVSGLAGGAIDTGPLAVLNSTLYGNTAALDPAFPLVGFRRTGGAIAALGGMIASTTIADNAGIGGGPAIDSLEPLTIVNSIVAGDPAVANCSGTIVDGGHNIDSGSTCRFSVANGSMSNTDPRLRGLGDNGGPTRTVSLYADSPAIDAGDAAVCPTRDQRGRLRVGVCDIGSFERQ